MAAVAAAVSRSGPERLFEVVWSPVRSVSGQGHEPVSVLSSDALSHRGPIGRLVESVVCRVEAVSGDGGVGGLAAVHRVLAAVQSWLTGRCSGGADGVHPRRGGVGGGGRQRSGRRGGVGAGAFGADRASRPHRAGGFRWPLDRTWQRFRRGGEPQVLLRGGQVYTARVRGSRAVTVLVPPASDGPWRLGISEAGTFENLRLEPVPQRRRAVGAGQVRVALRAIAANFRDVMITLGMFTHVTPARWRRRRGGGRGRPGRHANSPSAIGSRVLPRRQRHAGGRRCQRLLVRMPADWSYAEAAGISAAFSTAYMAFVHLAEVKPGQRVLVHAAAGGVGMAAVQLARHLGLEVFATASRGKWDTLRAMGFDDDHIGDSRSLEFEDKFRAVTGGRGMDVVLDSLAGEFVDASLRLLPGGPVLGDGQDRHPRPRGDRPGIPGCALPRL